VCRRDRNEREGHGDHQGDDVVLAEIPVGIDVRKVALNKASWVALGWAVIIAFSLSACRSEPASTAPSSVLTGIALVDGIVRSEVAQGSRESNPTPPTAGAQVAVIAGSAAGQQVTTNSNGAFQLPLPEGPFKLRWSKLGYTSVQSEQGNVSRGSHITMPDVVLRTAP
jgi:Carboxypeptidase regulatory-like domain